MVGMRQDDLDEVGHTDMGRRWNQWAYRLRGRAVVDAIDEHIGWSKVRRIFEGAFGVGFYLRLWRARAVPVVVGMDLSEAATEHCSAAFGAYDLRSGSLTELAAVSDYAHLAASFDVVTAIDVIYHIVDDTAAERALRALAGLVAYGGLFLATDKTVGLHSRFDEQPIVVRRPVKWYTDILTDCRLEPVALKPVFWCMDPPVDHARRSVSLVAATCGWWAMRAVTKGWKRNSLVQRFAGSVSGAVGYSVDSAMLRISSSSPNLQLLVYRRGGTRA